MFTSNLLRVFTSTASEPDGALASVRPRFEGPAVAPPGRLNPCGHYCRTSTPRLWLSRRHGRRRLGRLQYRCIRSLSRRGPVRQMKRTEAVRRLSTSSVGGSFRSRQVGRFVSRSSRSRRFGEGPPVGGSVRRVGLHTLEVEPAPAVDKEMAQAHVAPPGMLAPRRDQGYRHGANMRGSVTPRGSPGHKCPGRPARRRPTPVARRCSA